MRDRLPASPDLTLLSRQLAQSRSPVERRLAALLEEQGAEGDAAALELHRYHRKIDVARRVMAAYDESIRQPISDQEISQQGYVALAWVFLRAAERRSGTHEAERADRLRWINSALNCLDHLAQSSDVQADIEPVLQELMRSACSPCGR